MNESIKNMIERRSVRGYKLDMIPNEDLELILEAGTYAATGMGMQSPVIVAVTDKDTRDQLFQNERSRYGNRYRSVLRSTGCTGCIS